MRRTAFFSLLLSVLFSAGIGGAQAQGSSSPAPAPSAAPARPPVLDPALVPFVGDNCRKLYSDYLLGNYNRAFAVSRTGLCGYGTGHPTLEGAITDALTRCKGQRAVDCLLYSRNGEIVPEHERQRLTLGPLRSDPTHFFHGPAQAPGVIIWAHGRSLDAEGKPTIDNRNAPAAALTRALTNRGWDLLRLDRDPAKDGMEIGVDSVIQAVEQAHQFGYRRIVVGGQSFGGWLALQTAVSSVGSLVHGVLAVAPARHGRLTEPEPKQKAIDDFRALFAQKAPTNQRLFVAFFADDPFDPDSDVRAQIVRDAAIRGRSAHVVLSRPEGVVGHGGGLGLPFARRFSVCMTPLFESANPHAETCNPPPLPTPPAPPAPPAPVAPPPAPAPATLVK